MRLVQEVGDEEPAVYRGWMLRPEHYGLLYMVLLEKGLRLITSPVAYRFCHMLPEYYRSIKPLTPATLWLPPDCPTAEIQEVVSRFGDTPLIMKDYVRSRKHEWDEPVIFPLP
uniref:Uncharacterized protein n=1 Tax=Thermosporothrix sp. COM3 TaxID=2490863 RepID=A0A455SRM9_9CHLR|nr:hypothetical protein KTC_44500 [Thermosporothrix sp. COM3]